MGEVCARAATCGATAMQPAEATIRVMSSFIRIGLRRSIAVVVVTGALLTGIAVPAEATVVECPLQGPPPQSVCYTGYNTYPRPPGSSGLRSSMDGVVYSREYGGADELEFHLTVWDLSTDGYRARVWIYLYKGCWCTDTANFVPPTGGALHLGATYLRDSSVSTGNRYDWTYVNTTDPHWTAYTVRFVLGRFQNSTGNYDRYSGDKEQIFYLQAKT